MDKTDSSGPAFPFPTYTSPNGVMHPGEGGMTLRDYFAAKAMQGLMDAAMPMPEIAEAAYQMADAMLLARNS